MWCMSETIKQLLVYAKTDQIHFLPKSFIHHQEKSLWEFIKWSQQGKRFDVLSNFL